MSSYICGSSNFHPYECSHDKYCIHCTWGETEYHNPIKCALCQDLGFRMVKEKYARAIRVTDLSPRKQRIKLESYLSLVTSKPQEELPF